MKHFLRSHPNAVLISLALAFLAILIIFFVATTDTIVANIGSALVVSGSEQTAGFDLKGAAQLQYRGVSTSTNPTSTPVVAPSPAPTTTPVIPASSTASTTTP